MHLLAIVTCFVVRMPFSLKTARNKVDDERSATSRLDRLLVVGLVCGSISPFFHCFVPSLFAFADYAAASLARSTMSVAIGSVLQLVSIVVLAKGHMDLGRNFSPTLEIREKHTLTTSGIYKYVRHPMYTAFTLLALGQAFLVPNLVAGCGTLVANAALVGYRVFSKEENMLRREFGSAYDDYARNTARFIPFIL